MDRSKLLILGGYGMTGRPLTDLLQMEAEGTINGIENKMILRVSHADGYVLTAIPVAACLLQYLDGTIRQTGLCFESLVVEPKRFMADIKRLGAQVDCEVTP